MEPLDPSNPQALRETAAEELFDFFYIDPQGVRHALSDIHVSLTPGFVCGWRKDGQHVHIHRSSLQYTNKPHAKRKETRADSSAKD